MTMWKRFWLLAARFALRRAKHVSILVPREIDPLVEEAGQLWRVQEAQCAPGTSGEFKRSRVYGALIERHPQTSRRHIDMAIATYANLELSR